MSYPKIDLHFHSNFSDGRLSVFEIAEIIKGRQIKFCSLTDHNSVKGVEELKNILDGSGITVIPGVEITAKFGHNDLHILAYDFDVNRVAEILKEWGKIFGQQKIEEMGKAIISSRAQGFEITDGLAPLRKQPVSLTIALDICAKKNNQDLLMARHGREFTTEELFYEYQAPGKSCFVERSGVTVEWVVEKFRGVAKDLIIAHPLIPASVTIKPLSAEEINSLIQAGMTGIEVYHDHTADEQIKLLEDIVKEKQLHYTGGSDWHDRPGDPPLGQYGESRNIPGFKLTNYQ